MLGISCCDFVLNQLFYLVNQVIMQLSYSIEPSLCVAAAKFKSFKINIPDYCKYFNVNADNSIMYVLRVHYILMVYEQYDFTIIY